VERRIRDATHFWNVKDQWRRSEGGGKREVNQILLLESIYVPNLRHKANTLEEGDEHTNQ
jgi:hypothetical protein